MLTPIEKILFLLAVLVSLYFTWRGVQRIVKHISSGHGRITWSLVWKRIGELKAYNGMRDPRRAPVINSQVHASNLREAHRARFPAGGKIGLCAVVAIPHIVNCDLVAIDFCPTRVYNIWLPRSIVAWLQRQPPQRNKPESAKNNRKLWQLSADEYDRGEQNDHEKNGRERASGWKIKVQGAECPPHTQECSEPGKRPPDLFDNTHPIYGLNPFHVCVTLWILLRQAIRRS